jgi:putative aldouronate transport system substrate-binding protein
VKFKKVLCVVVIFMMAFMLFVSCSKEKDGKDSTKVDDPVISEKNGKEDVMVVTASFASNGVKYYETMTDIGNDKYIKKIEELTNIRLDLTIREHTKGDELINLLFASKDIPDLFGAGNPLPVVDQAVKNGVFLNMKPYINEENTPNLLKKVPERAWPVTDVLRDGSIYFIPGYQNVLTNYALYVREDLLEKYNLSVPTTLDELTDVLRVFKENGLKYPIIGREGANNLRPIFGAHGVLIGTSYDYYIMSDDGKIVPSAIQPGMKKALAYVRSLYEEGLLDPEFATNTLDPFTNKILNGDVGVFNHGASNYPTWQEGIVKNIPDAKFKMILGPVGPDGDSAVEYAYSPISAETYVNKNVKDPARIARFFDWMCTDEAEEFFCYGIEGDTYTKENGKVNFTYPTTVEGEDELFVRTYNLWRVRDTYDKPLLTPYIPHAQYIQEYREEVARADNVLHAVHLLGDDLEVYNTSPELRCTYNADTLFQEIAMKIIFGKVEVDEFDNWVKEWKARGGDKVLEQLEEKRKSGEYIIY